MVKTTVYLAESEIEALKVRAAKMRESAACLIRSAVRDFLGKEKRKGSYPFLRRSLRRKPAKTSFGDPVHYQQTLRKEWS